VPDGIGEFALIARYLAPLAGAVPGAFGLLDDAAVIRPPDGCDLVVTTDAMVETVHFLKSDGGRSVARKLLRVNLSDLAAKGAAPIGYQLVLGMPAPLDENWLADFAAGLAQDQEAFGFPLYGGDTVRSPAGLMLAVTAFGSVPQGCMVQRSGAEVGDDIYVTGSIGDAALGLEAKLNHRLFPSASKMMFDSRLLLPSPRLAFGRGLRGIAHASLDVSDGLVQDAGHLADTAGVKAIIVAEGVPLSLAARGALAEDPSLLSVILTGGDDYELLFTAPPEAGPAVKRLSKSVGLAVTRIGRIEAGRGVTVQDAQGKHLLLAKGGFQHFGGSVE